MPLVAGGLTAATLTWRTPYLAFAIAPFLAGLLLMAVLPASTDRARGGGSLEIFRQLAGVFRVVGPLLSIAIMFQMLMAAIYAFLALYLVDARGFDAPVAAAIVATPFLAGLLGSPLGGALSDRIGRKPVIVWTLVATGPILLLLNLVPTLLLIPVMFLMGLVGSARMPVIEGLLLDRAAPERRATTLGAYYLAAQELGGFAAPALGAIAGAVGIGQAFGAVGAVAALFSLGLLLVQHKL
jgi:predicted MFS family arabinose efflux permease